MTIFSFLCGLVCGTLVAFFARPYLFITYLRIENYVVAFRTRCYHCKRRRTVCNGRNECEASQRARLQWQAQTRAMVLPAVGFLGKLLTHVSENAAQDTELKTPDLSGDVKPPNG